MKSATTFNRCSPIALAVALACVLPALQPAQAAEPSYAATVQPLGLILEELCAGRATVSVIIPAGSSPHTYDPRPSDAKKAAAATALFYVHEELDAWAAELEARERVEVFEALPSSLRLEMGEHFDWDEAHGHSHGEHSDATDPHFWLDPLAVKAALPALTKKLSALDPAGKSTYESNAASFSKALDALDAKLRKQLAPVKGQALMMFHPAFQYMAKRYGLKVAGAIEPFPGREPSPKYIVELIERIKADKVRALFTEPQLPPKPAKALAEATGLPLYVLDPNGGSSGRDSYSRLIQYNADTLLEALSP